MKLKSRSVVVLNTDTAKEIGEVPNRRGEAVSCGPLRGFFLSMSQQHWIQFCLKNICARLLLNIGKNSGLVFKGARFIYGVPHPSLASATLGVEVYLSTRAGADIRGKLRIFPFLPSSSSTPRICF